MTREYFNRDSPLYTLKDEIELNKGPDVTVGTPMSLVLVGRRVYRLLDPEVGEKVYLLNIDPSVDATYVPTWEPFRGDNPRLEMRKNNVFRWKKFPASSYVTKGRS